MLAQRIETVELPAGVKHKTTTAVALSWGAWEALAEEDGWEERTWTCPPHELVYPAGIHTQKENTISGHLIVVFPPHQPEVEA